MRAGRRCGGCWYPGGTMSKIGDHDGPLVAVGSLLWGIGNTCEARLFGLQPLERLGVALADRTPAKQ